MKPFRKNHIINILTRYENSQSALDLFLHQYFKSNHAIGSNDRKEIAETVYSYIRWKGLIDFFNKQGQIAQKVEWLLNHDPFSYRNEPTIPDHIKVSFPKEYFEAIEESLGRDKAIEFCLASNSKAPIYIRANPLKISRDELLFRLSDRFHVTACEKSPLGLEVHGKALLFQTPEFQDGFFEMQDEASQVAACMMEAKPKDAILDFCCGAGGKTLAFAFKLEKQGQIYIHDIRENALLEAKKRLNRAGIQNYQILKPSTTYWNEKKHKMDWIFVDAPCSGSGTLRRNPDQKWKFQRKDIEELTQLQKEIFDQALLFLKPKGKIIYATCSILKEENMEQIDFFCQKYKMTLAKDPFISITSKDKMDGFFAAVLEKL